MPAITLHAAEEEHSPHSLIPFLHSQPQTLLTRLYQRPSACLSIFRLLAPLQQQIIMNLLWLEAAISSTTMSAWVVRDARKKVTSSTSYDTALSALFKLHILSTANLTKLVLNSTFKTSLRQALTGGGATGSFGVPAEPDDKHPPMSVEALDGYALERWETILHYMVSSGTGQGSIQPSKDVLFLLKQSGLMASGTNQITSEGFQFLLQSPHAQLWQLLLEYLRMAEARSMDLVEVLSFLFMLSTMELGREYSTAEGANAGTTSQAQMQTQKAMLADLRDYGLVWTRKSNVKRFHPTRLATTLTSTSPPLPSSAGPGAGPKEGFIVLETNYRVYAYTDNPLQTAVLNLFVSLKYRFPNLVVGSITRESVKKALASGISAEQIISYLIAHAHPQMRKNNPLLPVTVQDQIRLWELERNRLKSSEGYLYTDFSSEADYQLVLNYAKQMDLVIWESSAKRCFFASTEGHPRIKAFIERRTAEAGSADGYP
ncbi:RNA polymerase II transcription factor B subunit 2 [Mycena chlorophos]|uniref:RNA polymerase II transcription factor B subunit 2 n=1 Tax=Mycena chlorophos TaxID=658473 RepID=A0A8H6TGD3_MYCCL|nr:RNA polymerase II transcription factor B subunit 2 [Mycena chlorophos]